MVGAEESGLVGSEHYVTTLSSSERNKIALNLNFDMVGSPNYVRFVYDGDGSDTETAGPKGSDVIEQVFLDYFEEAGLETEPTAFDGRSDYGPFIDVGIPAAACSQAPRASRRRHRPTSTAGPHQPYDPCYHQACDTFENNSNEALDQMSDAAAHATLVFAMWKGSLAGPG